MSAIAELRELLDLATDGPWYLTHAAEVRLRNVNWRDEDGIQWGVAYTIEPEDADLIVLAPRLARVLIEHEEETRRALMFIEDAIEATGSDEEELIAEETNNVWVRIICARDTLKAALASFVQHDQQEDRE